MTDKESMLFTKYELMYAERLARVETTLENIDRAMSDNFKEIKSDIRWMFVTMIGFSGIILSLMAKGFHWL